MFSWLLPPLFSWLSPHNFSRCMWLVRLVWWPEKTHSASIRISITTVPSSTITAFKETASAIWFFHTSHSHSLSPCNTGHLETPRQLAEVIMASSVDTVRKKLHNYTCSHIMLSESGVSTVERFTCFVVWVNSLVICLQRQNLLQ